MLDYIHHWELASFYRQAAIFIYPSKYETFGIPPLEAMACGCPVITSNYSCIPEIVENGAEIVDTANHGLFAEKMHSLLIDKKFRDDLIKRGGIQCKKYSWANNSKETLNEIMSRLLTKRKNGQYSDGVVCKLPACFASVEIHCIFEESEKSKTLIGNKYGQIQRSEQMR